MKAMIMILGMATFFLTSCGGAQTEQAVSDSTNVVDTVSVQDSTVQDTTTVGAESATFGRQ